MFDDTASSGFDVRSDRSSASHSNSPISTVWHALRNHRTRSEYSERPATVGDVVAPFEVLGHERPAPPVPVSRGPAQRPDPHPAKVPGVDAGHAAFGERLRRLVALDPAALEQHDRQARSTQVQRDGHAGSAGAGDADVGLERRALIEGPGIDQHGVGGAVILHRPAGLSARARPGGPEPQPDSLRSWASVGLLQSSELGCSPGVRA